MKNEFEKHSPVQLEVLQSKYNTHKRSRLLKTISGIVGVIAVPSLASATFLNDKEDKITAAKIEILPFDNAEESAAALINVESDTVYVDTTSVETTTPDTTSVDTTTPDTTSVETTTPDTTSVETTTPDTTVVTTTPETTTPQQGLDVQGYDNQDDNLIEPGDVVTYTINISNPDPINKIVQIHAGFKDSFAISQISDIRISNCSSYIDNSGSLYVNLENIVLPPGETCTLSYDVNIVFTGQTLISYAKIYDLTTQSLITKDFKYLYS